MPETARRTKHNAVREKARALITESWQSQANLSFFLALLVVVGFILPSLGFGKDDERLYSDATFSLLLISGVAIAWGRRWLFALACFVGSAALAVRWMAYLTPSPRVASVGRHLVVGSDFDDRPGAAGAGFSPRAGYVVPHSGRHRGLPAVRNWLGARLPHHGNATSRIVSQYLGGNDELFWTGLTIAL